MLLALPIFRFKGHQNSNYRIDCGLTSYDSTVVAGSEDGKLYCWDLITV